jgi:hypothetical protein
MRASHVDFASHWHIGAPLQQVWAALSDPPAWPRWWPYVREVQTLRRGDPTGVGTVWHIVWATRLPVRIVIDAEVVEAVRYERLRARSRGPLCGEGIWLLRDERGCTGVTHVWRVEFAAPWLRWLSPLLAPVLRRIHHGVMRTGCAGLQRHLVQAAAVPAAR